MKTLIQIGSLGQSRKSLMNTLVMALVGSSQKNNEPMSVYPIVPTETEKMSSVVGKDGITVICVLSTPTESIESIDPSFLESFVKEDPIRDLAFPFAHIRQNHFIKPDKGTFPKMRTHTRLRRGHHGFW